jgi:hypothetical protein
MRKTNRIKRFSYIKYLTEAHADAEDFDDALKVLVVDETSFSEHFSRMEIKLLEKVYSIRDIGKTVSNVCVGTT